MAYKSKAQREAAEREEARKAANRERARRWYLRKKQELAASKGVEAKPAESQPVDRDASSLENAVPGRVYSITIMVADDRASVCFFDPLTGKSETHSASEAVSKLLRWATDCVGLDRRTGSNANATH